MWYDDPDLVVLAALRWEIFDARTDIAEDFWNDYGAVPAWGS